MEEDPNFKKDTLQYLFMLCFHMVKVKVAEKVKAITYGELAIKRNGKLLKKNILVLSLELGKSITVIFVLRIIRAM